MEAIMKSGIYREHFDTSRRPGDDLFRHVCGHWLDTVVIPEDKSYCGTFTEVCDRTEEQIHAILASCNSGANGEEGLIGALYQSFMDSDRIEAVGVAALDADLEKPRAATDKAALAAAMASLQGVGLQALWPGTPTVKGVLELLCDPDMNDPGTYQLSLTQSGLGLSNKLFYEDEKFVAIRDSYVAHIAEMVRRADLFDLPKEDADTVASKIMSFETALAAGQWELEKCRDFALINNPMSWDALKALAPGFCWDTWAEGWGLPEAFMSGVNVQEPSYLEALSDLWRDTPFDEIRHWLIWRILSARAPFLNKALADESFHFNGQLLTGAQKEKERWRRGVELSQLIVGDAVGKRYVEKHFPPEARERITELADNLLAAYRVSIEAVDWLGAATKARALDKLAAFSVRVGCPSRWRDYGPLRFDPANLLANLRSGVRFETLLQLGNAGKPVDREVWALPPQTVNAYFNPNLNMVVFPAGILQPPIFDYEADDAVNYGCIGAVIAHEIGHGFDDQGSKFDAQGRLASWWDETDRAAFEKRIQQLVDQFDAYVPAGLGPEHHVNGQQTLGENIADLGGLTMAVLAYKLSLGSGGGEGAAGAAGEAPVLDGMTGLQRLFFGWTQFWRWAIRPEEAIRWLVMDVHSPSEFRANGAARNVPEFYEAFDVQPGDALYLPPEQRVRIW
jgi:putative endopeptidase